MAKYKGRVGRKSRDVRRIIGEVENFVDMSQVDKDNVSWQRWVVIVKIVRLGRVWVIRWESNNNNMNIMK